MNEKSGRQTHLGIKPGIGDKPTLTVKEFYHRDFGFLAFDQSEEKPKKKLKDLYRETQISYDPSRGKTGQDEMVSTATTQKIVDHLKQQGFAKELIRKVVGRLSEERLETSKLMWSTGIKTQPLSGHPGSLSKSLTDMRKGHTKQHFTFDKKRAELVLQEFKQTLQETNDVKTAVERCILMARIATVQLMMQPTSVLDQVDVSSSKTEFHSARHGTVVKFSGIKKPTKTRKFKYMTKRVGSERERLKWQTAHQAMTSGMLKLVHPIYQKYLKRYSTILEAMRAFHRDSNGRLAPPIHSSALKLPSKSKKSSPFTTPPRLEDMAKISGEKKGYPLSPPRPFTSAPEDDPSELDLGGSIRQSDSMTNYLEPPENQSKITEWLIKKEPMEED